jgi:hypothetical protein
MIKAITHNPPTITGSRSVVKPWSARACFVLATFLAAGSLASGELARLARGFRPVVRVFDASFCAMVLLGSLARIVFIPAGGLGGGIGVFVRVDALVADVPIFDLVAMMLQFLLRFTPTK